MISLFTPATAGTLSLPNRVVMPPMTRFRADENAAPNALHEEYYRPRRKAPRNPPTASATPAPRPSTPRNK